MKLTIVCQGSANPPHNGMRTGSFRILHGAKILAEERDFELGWGTAPEGAWLSAQAGAVRAICGLIKRQTALSCASVTISTSSPFVAATLKRPPTARPEEGAKAWVLDQNLRRMLAQFGSWDAEWRSENI